ncbi:alcohol dehydrogenase 4 [Anaeramoeba flamelloides]|uniref:Alcohol dehydrogenase 4 n=1 Tax=Anaeramoeba flamelloides TaxID=1746091 RepID=A0ABQ8YUX2_9EUKA|nr:alcohol dehydrogenase 4 [Anaeramoeba flamelloides]
MTNIIDDELFDINTVCTIRGHTCVKFGCGAINTFKEDFAKLQKGYKITTVGVITGKSSYKSCGAWDVVKPALDELNIKVLLYDKVKTNPSKKMVNEALELFREDKPQYLISIGGGSPTDTAKVISVLLEFPKKTMEDFYNGEFSPLAEERVPLFVINTTAGTGTEIDQFAVVSDLEFNPPMKPIFVTEAIYPTHAINDPNLLLSVPKGLTLYTGVDALNHAMEACSTVTRSPFSYDLAIRVSHLVHKYLPIALKEPENKTARYWLHYAACIAGISFDNGLLHMTHSLEHSLAAFDPKIPHGLGLAVLQPSVLKRTYAALPKIMAKFLLPFDQTLEGKPEEAEKAACILEKWLMSIGITEKIKDLGFTEKDIPKLVESVYKTPPMSTLLSIAPFPIDKDVVAEVYKEAMTPLSKK